MGSATFSTAGGPYHWTCPAGVTSVVVDLIGGCLGSSFTRPPKAGRVTATYTVVPGRVYDVYVGGGGGSPSGTSGGAGGYPNGGAGGSGAVGGGYGGGGFSGFYDGTGLSNWVAIAGGAGGSMGAGSDGGYGGEPTITNGTGLGTNGGSPGTASAGGASHGVNGSPGSSGTGGQGGNDPVAGQFGAGGGGSGLWGGAGGGIDSGTGTNSSGGGGGSNYHYTGLTSVTSTTDASGHFGDGIVTLTWNSPPNAPSLTGPANNTNLDQTIVETFTWTFSDPDPGDSQASADFQWRVGAGAWTVVTGVATTAGSYAAPANTFTSVTGSLVEWQVRTTDSHGSVGPWSTSRFFTPYPPPSAPTLVSPAITSSAVNVSVTHGGVNYRQMEAKVVNDVSGSPGSTILATNAPAGQYGAPGVSSSNTNMPPATYVNGTHYHILARVANPPGVWSPYTDSGSITAALGVPPLAPTAAVTAVPGSGTVNVVITNPGSDPHPPSYNDVYRTDLTRNGQEIRIATGVPLNSTFTDYFCPATSVTRYRVVAVTASGGTASSP